MRLGAIGVKEGDVGVNLNGPAKILERFVVFPMVGMNAAANVEGARMSGA